MTPMSKDPASNFATLFGVDRNLSHIRERPGMYIGWTDEKGLHYLACELINNAVNEARRGYCNEIAVELLPTGSCRVSDNGRGIWAEEKSDKKCVSLASNNEALFKICGGLVFGLMVVNALSCRVVVDEFSAGVHWRQDFGRGGILSEPVLLERTDKTGTSIEFWPDPEIFEGSTVFSFETLAERCQVLAALHKGLRISLADRRSSDGKSTHYHFPRGLADLLPLLSPSLEPVHVNIFSFEVRSPELEIEVAARWTRSHNAELVHSYANAALTEQEGTHVRGVRKGIGLELHRYLARAGTGSATEEGCRRGRELLVAVNLREPQFELATRSRLGNPEIARVVITATSDNFARFLIAYPDDARAIAGHIMNVRTSHSVE